jgi:hypothetical protein
MRKFAALAGLLSLSAAFIPVHAAESTGGPDFQANGVAWIAMNQDLVAVPGEQPPTYGDKDHPYVPNGRGVQPTFRIADLANPNLKPWAKEVMKKDNDEVLKGKVAFTARSSCMPAGVPGFSCDRRTSALLSDLLAQPASTKRPTTATVAITCLLMVRIFMVSSTSLSHQGYSRFSHFT